MRHSISVGGRFLPPPKYWSYSIFSCRMSRSIWPSSSSIVAMGKGPRLSMLGLRTKSVNDLHKAECKNLYLNRLRRTCTKGQEAICDAWRAVLKYLHGRAPQT